MRQMPVALFSLVVLAVFTSGGSAADVPPRSDATTANALVGTWKMVKATYGGKEAVFAEGHTELKHITPTQFVLTAFDVKDGKVFAVIGGPYTFKGETYEELPEYGISEVFTMVKGTRQTFTVKLQANRWTQSGTLSNGLVLEEVWERVER